MFGSRGKMSKQICMSFNALKIKAYTVKYFPKDNEKRNQKKGQTRKMINM